MADLQVEIEAYLKENHLEGVKQQLEDIEQIGQINITLNFLEL